MQLSNTMQERLIEIADTVADRKRAIGTARNRTDAALERRGLIERTEIPWSEHVAITFTVEGAKEADRLRADREEVEAGGRVHMLTPDGNMCGGTGPDTAGTGHVTCEDCWTLLAEEADREARGVSLCSVSDVATDECGCPDCEALHDDQDDDGAEAEIPAPESAPTPRSEGTTKTAPAKYAQWQGERVIMASDGRGWARSGKKWVHGDVYELEKRNRNPLDGTHTTGWYLYGGVVGYAGVWCASRLLEAAEEASAEIGRLEDTEAERESDQVDEDDYAAEEVGDIPASTEGRVTVHQGAGRGVAPEHADNPAARAAADAVEAAGLPLADLPEEYDSETSNATGFMVVPRGGAEGNTGEWVYVYFLTDGQTTDADGDVPRGILRRAARALRDAGWAVDPLIFKCVRAHRVHEAPVPQSGDHSVSEEIARRVEAALPQRTPGAHGGIQDAINRHHTKKEKSMFTIYAPRPRPSVEAVEVTDDNLAEIAELFGAEYEGGASRVAVNLPIGDGQVIRMGLGIGVVLVRHAADRYSVTTTREFHAGWISDHS